MLGMILLVLLVLLLVGALPAWPHAADWGYRPASVLVTLVVVVVVLVLLGWLPAPQWPARNGGW
jgi:hypothetical protein